MAESGAHKLQAYWPLKESLSPDVAKVALERLGDALDADRASRDVGRVLRAAGTLNYKHHPPRPVRCVRAELDKFRVSEIAGDIATPSAVATSVGPAHPRQRATPARIAGGPMDVRAITSAEYVPRLTGRQVDRDGFVRCPLHKHGQERTPSLHVSETRSDWFCHGDGCRKGGGLIEFWAALTRQPVPARGREFVRLVYEVQAALLGTVAP